MLYSLFLHWLIPVAHAVILEQAGSWSATGQPNFAIQSMWIRICTTLPYCSIGPNAPVFFISKLILFIGRIISGIAVIMIIYAGIKLVLSRGNDEALAEARKILLYAVVGLILAMMAKSVMLYLSSIFLPQVLQ